QGEAAQERNAGHSPAVNASIQRFGVYHHLTLRVAHSNRQGLRAAHHHSFDDGLPAIIELSFCLRIGHEWIVLSVPGSVKMTSVRVKWRAPGVGCEFRGPVAGRSA